VKIEPDIAAKAVSRDVTHAGLLVNPAQRDAEAVRQLFRGEQVALTVPLPVHCLPDSLTD